MKIDFLHQPDHLLTGIGAVTRAGSEAGLEGWLQAGAGAESATGAEAGSRFQAVAGTGAETGTHPSHQHPLKIK